MVGKAPSPMQWAEHRATIEDLYLVQRLEVKEVARKMSELYNFHAEYGSIFF